MGWNCSPCIKRDAVDAWWINRCNYFAAVLRKNFLLFFWITCINWKKNHFTKEPRVCLVSSVERFNVYCLWAWFIHDLCHFSVCSFCFYLFIVSYHFQWLQFETLWTIQLQAIVSKLLIFWTVNWWRKHLNKLYESYLKMLNQTSLQAANLILLLLA